MAEEHQKPQIDMLPEEMLVEVFSYLNFRDLTQVVRVQKSWNTVVSENSAIMKKMMLKFDVDSKEWNEIFKATKNFERRYHTVSIDNCVVWNKDAMNTMKKFGADLHCIELNSCEFSVGESKMITRILKMIDKLETLKMTDVDLDVYVESGLIGVKPLNLEKLKSVTMLESSWNMLEFFKLSQLTSLKISGTLSSDMEEYLIGYLATQTKLEELALRDIDFTLSELKTDQVEKLTFPLKRLALHKQKMFMAGEDSAKAFMNAFASTLEYLELGSKFENSLFSLIFQKLQKLQCLDLDARGLPNDEAFYKTLRNLPSVKKLVVRHFKVEHQQSLQGILGNLQDIETLIIDGDTSNHLMSFISNNLLNLTSLGINELDGKLFNNVKMPKSLKKLTVHRLGKVSGKDWHTIFMAMPEIEELTIRHITDPMSFNEAKINSMTRAWKQLRVLNVGPGLVPTKRMLRYLLKRCTNLKTVQIASYERYDLTYKDFKKPGLRLLSVNPYLIDEPSGNFGEMAQSLWDANDVFEFSGDADSDDYSSGGSMFDEIGLAIGGFFNDPDREDQVYFDSDGEMRYWDEDPEDYGIDFY